MTDYPHKTQTLSSKDKPLTATRPAWCPQLIEAKSEQNRNTCELGTNCIEIIKRKALLTEKDFHSIPVTLRLDWEKDSSH